MVPMGKVEKIVVLSVLFLITLILVVSLSSTPEDPSRAQTGTNLARVPAGEALPGTARPAARNPAPGSTTALAAEREAARPGTLLDSSVAAEPRASAPDTTPAPVTTPAPAPAADLPQGTVLVSADGLLPSYLDDYRFYAWRQGDTWEAVAERYRGAGRTGLLRRANEGRERVAPGEKILVPVFDLEPGRRDAPAAVLTASAMTPSGVPGPAAAARPVQNAAGGTGYTVVEGDSLWRIAKKVYGEGSRWQSIFDATRDVLATADDLAPGQTLRIP
jgi:nucleoid-associated protein YgaU